MEFAVELTKDHLERLAKTQPLTGIIELIWNAFDADATDVKVEFGRNELDGIEEIRVVDDGHGMTPAEVERAFGALGGSHQSFTKTSPSGRSFHGRDGQGRYKAAGIGNRIVWATVAASPDDDAKRVMTGAELQFSDLVRVVTTEPIPTDSPPGTRVVIPDLGANPPEGLGGDGPVDRLTATFALQLQNSTLTLPTAALRSTRPRLKPSATTYRWRPSRTMRCSLSSSGSARSSAGFISATRRACRSSSSRRASSARVQLHCVSPMDRLRRRRRSRPDDVEPRRR